MSLVGKILSDVYLIQFKHSFFTQFPKEKFFRKRKFIGCDWWLIYFVDRKKLWKIPSPWNFLCHLVYLCNAISGLERPTLLWDELLRLTRFLVDSSFKDKTTKSADVAAAQKYMYETRLSRKFKLHTRAYVQYRGGIHSIEKPKQFKFCDGEFTTQPAGPRPPTLICTISSQLAFFMGFLVGPSSLVQPDSRFLSSQHTASVH